MKKLIVLSIVLISTIAHGAGFQVRDKGGFASPLFTPDGNFTTLLTANSTTYDMTNAFSYSILGVSGCKARTMPTSTTGGYIAVGIPAGVWVTFGVNKNTPFLNLSGCAAGYKMQQN